MEAVGECERKEIERKGLAGLDLAPRAKIGAPSPDNYSLNDVIAFGASFIFSPVNHEHILECTRFTTGTPIIADTGSSALDGHGQNLPYRFEQPADFGFMQTPDPGQRMDTCQEKAFVSIYISQSGEKFLVQEKALDP